MSNEVILTCAVTGANSGAVGVHPDLPITPKQIADAAIASAEAGAAVAHIHVRDPETGAPSNRPDLYKEVVDRIRDSDTDVVINLTTGMDGDIILDPDNPRIVAEGSTVKPPLERMEHIELCLPEICTLDCGVMAWGGETIYVARHQDLMKMAAQIQALGVKPELEVFGPGQISNVQKLLAEDVISGRPLFQFCLGTTAGAPATTSVMQAMKEMLPSSSHWAAFGVGQTQFPMVAQALLLGGNVRVGLEDNLRLRRGVFATNVQLVEQAVGIIEALGKTVMSPADVRKKLDLTKRAA